MTEEIDLEAISKLLAENPDIVLEASAGATAGLTDPIGQIRDFIVSSFNSISSWIVSSIEAFITDVSAGINAAISSAVNTITSAVSSVQAIAGNVYDYITDSIPKLQDMVAGVSSSLASLSAIVESIPGQLSALVGSLSDQLSAIGSSILSNIQDYMSSLASSITNTIAAIQNTIGHVIDTIHSAASTIISSVTTTIKDAWGWLVDTVASLMRKVSETILGAIGAAVSTITNAISSAQDALSSAIKALLGAILKGLDMTRATITGNIAWLWNMMSSSIAQLGSLVSTGFEWVARTFMGFANTVARAVDLTIPYLRGIAESMARLGEAIGALGGTLKDLLANTYAWLQEHLVKPAVGFLTWVWNGILWAVGEASKAILGWVRGALQWLWGGLLAIGETVIDVVLGAYDSIVKFGEGIRAKFAETIFSPLTKFFQEFGETFESLFKQLVERITTGKSRGEALELAGLVSAIFAAQYGVRALTLGLYWLGEQLRRYNLRWSVSLSIFTGKGTMTIPVVFDFGAILLHIAREMKGAVDEFFRGIVYGASIWYTRPLMRLVNALWRNQFPIELPQLDDILEMWRRMTPLAELLPERAPERQYASWVRDNLRKFLAYYGYSDFSIDLYLQHENRLSTQVTDRFGIQRRIPLSLRYVLPSPSDVARMVIRDVIQNIDDIRTVFSARGMNPDIGTLYYLLHFRYPPPERLWEFTMRGVSGLLWMVVSKDEEDTLKRQIEGLGLKWPDWKPASPSDLNFKPDTLFSALKAYMKWHDYARFPYIKGFTSDNLIYLDTLADIPTKIDQRWMVKWGLYEVLSWRGVTYQSPVQDFTYKLLDSQAASNITMDITNFARTLQATGIHPYWIPVVAVAEAMNTLTDERTLLRTGFINLFKEGFWNVRALETLLAGFVTASFKVSYFDIHDYKWKTGWVNLPVMFLPPERKLLELRALMDRALDILREIQRDITRGYQEWIIADYDEYKTRLSKVIDAVNEIFTRDYQSITGTQLPDELKLKFVEDYYKPYIQGLDVWRDIFTIRRVRYWTQRWLGWIMYRVATGVVKEEDFTRLAGYIAEKAKLTPYERDYIYGVMKLISGIAEREYIPTPSQLATIAEYIPEARKYFPQVVSERRIPDEWAPLWAKYVDIKPLVNEIRAYRSRVEDLYVYFAITREDYLKVLKDISGYIGYTQKEIDFILKSSEYERMRRAWMELVGTIRELVSLSEYSPKAKEYARGQLKKLVEALPLPPQEKKEIEEMWEEYIRNRTVKSEARLYVNQLINLYVDGLIDELTLKKELQEMKKWGFSDDEIMFYEAAAALRKARKLKIPLGG